MAMTLLPEGLWERIESLMPQHQCQLGRPWADDRDCLEDVFVPSSGIP